MGLVIIARMPTLAEAHIAAGALRAAGIAAEVFDANFGGVEAPVIEGLGGFRIMAPQDEAQTARETLRALQSSPGLVEPDDHPETVAVQPTSVAARPLANWLTRVLGLASTV